MTKAPRWAVTIMRKLAPDGQVDDVLGDLEEARRQRLRRHSPTVARILTTVEALEMTAALARARFHAFRTNKGNNIVQDYKLGFRMLLKYPGLTFAGGLALAIAIGIGAGWHDLSGDLFRPRIPLPNGDRIVEAEMRDSMNPGDERRILHDFLIWRAEARSLEHLGAYRSIERNLILGDARPEPIRIAETTASAFRVAGVAPLHGRPLLDADEQRGAPPVVVLGYDVWQRRFGGRVDVVGQPVQLGRTAMTIVGVMPEGFAFPINHRMWVPLQLQPAGYAPLEGVGIRVFGLIAPGATQAQANTELAALVEREKAAFPQAYQHLSPRVLAYGGESPGDSRILEIVVRNLPIILVLVVACANVGTLIYARTATREAEIATRYALGASRARIIGQLFVEALVLASVAAVAGLTAAHYGLKWGFAAYLEAQGESSPFWIEPGLKPATVLFAAVLTTLSAALLSLLPAIKATGAHVQPQLRNLGSGGSTLRFGGVWTAAMIAQVALTVICIPAAIGISEEAFRDRRIRAAFPGERYLTLQAAFERRLGNTTEGDEPPAAFAARVERTYRELTQGIAQEPGVLSVTFGDRMPGMEPGLAGLDLEDAAGNGITVVPTVWTAAVGADYFDAFDKPILAGRDFHDGDRVEGARTVVVNEAFARRYTGGSSPVGRRVRWTAANPAKSEPWLEIVGMVQDIGMTPTDLGEAPYVFTAVTPATARPLVLGIRVAGDPLTLMPRLRELALALDPELRLAQIGTLEDVAYQVELPMLVMAGTIAVVVGLGLFLSAAGIFALMSVNVARRTREIGLRAALGATPGRLLRGIFTRALALLGGGIAAGNAVIILFVVFQPDVGLVDVVGPLATTSVIMLVVGLLACAGPARRAMRIQPSDALKDA